MNIRVGTVVGFATAQRFAKEGYHVVLVVYNKEIRKSQPELEDKVIVNEMFSTDIINNVLPKLAITSAEKHFGSIDVTDSGPTPSFDRMCTPHQMTVDNELQIIEH